MPVTKSNGSTRAPTFRNTASFVSGWNVSVSDTLFADGGVPHGGTNPRYCLDIEPNSPTDLIRHVRILGCTFRNARNVAVGAIWCKDVSLDDCRLTAGPDTAQGILLNTSYCDITIANSSFDGTSYFGCYIRQVASYGQGWPQPTSAFLHDEGVNSRLLLNNNRFLQVGAELQGHTAIVRNNNFLNSPKAVFVMAPFGVVEHNVLTNCGWADPNGGRYAALCIGYNTDKRRRYLVSHNLVRFSESYLSKELLQAVNPAKYYGIFIQEINAEIQLIGNRSEGFYRFPDTKGQPRNINYFRDWSSPLLPPADATTQTRVIQGNSYGGPDWVPETPFG